MLRNRQSILSALVLHNSRYVEVIPPRISINLLCRANRGRCRKPADLAILLIHNRAYKTVLEQSLDYLGIEGYSVARPVLPVGIWRNTYKIRAAIEFLRTCKERYVFYIDSDDAILLGDPQRAIDLLEESGGKMLVSTTNHAGYDFMPHMEGWFTDLAQKGGWSADAVDVHLNSGVYVAEREYLRHFLNEVAEYITDNDSWFPQYRIANQGKGHISPPFPMGCGSDQNIFRFIFPRFADEIRIDYPKKLAFR